VCEEHQICVCAVAMKQLHKLLLNQTVLLFMSHNNSDYPRSTGVKVHSSDINTDVYGSK